MGNTIIIDENMQQQIEDLLAMTQFKFKANLIKFLASLSEDPVGAEPDIIFTHNGLDKNKLIKALVDNKVITKKMTIDDHDEDGNPHTARMIVKYTVPKERFSERLDALYDVLFPDVDAKINEECDEATGCSSVGGGGSFLGNGESYEYDYPAFGKKKGVSKKSLKNVGGNPYTLTEKVIRVSESQAKQINESAVDRFIDKIIFNRLPKQLKQYVNTPVNDLLAKRPDLVNAQSLGATEAELAQLGGYPLKDFIRLSISKMFDIGHGKGPKKYLKGIFRIVLDELNYLQHPDQNAIQNLKNDVMYIMQASENGSDPDAMKLDGNLNGLNAGQLHNMFKDKRKAFAQGLRNKVSSMFKGGRSDYKVVPILKHEDAVKFQPYTSWCITYNSSSNYDQYVSGGRRFYVFLKNGFENVPKQVGENCPMDEYGLSMISILVDMEGNIDYITTRWNHDHDGEYHNPDTETVQAFQNVIGMNLYDVCKPYTREELHAMGITLFDEVPELLAQGVPLNDIFDRVGDFYNGFTRVELNDKYNWVRDDNRQLLRDQWFDDVGYFKNGFADVELNSKYNWVRADNGQFFNDQWYDWVGSFENGFARVELDGKYNLVRADNGQLLYDQWFDWVGSFDNGLAAVRLNGKWNFVRADNGRFLCEDWFDWVGGFDNGLADVRLNGNQMWVDTKGKLYDYNPRNRMVSESLVERIVKRIISEAVTGKDAEKAAAIYAYCLDDKEEDYCILCAKRLEGDEKNKWNPPMGHLHVDESPKDGAVRECEEESGVKIPKSKLHLGSTEDWGKNYWVILDGTIKDWPVGKGDGENSKFEWKSVHGLFYGKDKDLEWAWNTKDFVYKFAPAELDLDESTRRKAKVLTESKKKQYLNMNVELRKGGRSAVKMSVDDFKQEMIHAYHQYSMEQDEKYKSSLQLTPTPGNFVYSLCYGSKINKKSKYASALYDDIWNGKYKFDTENVDAYGGIKMSKKGFPYLQCDAGGDWECPVCFFVYFDGNKFRGYVPLKGNALNRNEKHAFSGGGNEPDAKFVQKELGLSYEEADHMCGDIDYNVDACLEDFLSRVEVKGTYKKRDHTKDEERFKEYRKEKIADEKRRGEEAERTRQMNAQKEEGIQNPEGSEELKFRTLGSEDEITEATATGTGGLPGEFTVPFPADKKDPSLDRTPGDTMGMHDRVGKSNLQEKRKKIVKNDEGKVVPEFCKKCGGKVGTYICGEPIYKCCECGEYYGTVPFTLHKKKK